MADKNGINPNIEVLIKRGDKAGNFPISNANESDFEQGFFKAFECSKQYAKSNLELKQNADQNYLQCGIKQAVLSN